VAHADTQILNAVAARLVSMTTVADSSVTIEHTWDFTDAVLPAIDLTLPECAPLEDEDEATLGSVITMRAQLEVTSYAKTGAGCGNQLRAMAAEVASKLYASATDTDLGGLVSEVDPQGYELELAVEEQPVGRLVQRFGVVYRVVVNDLETIVDS
jgi:hypothetical protein